MLQRYPRLDTPNAASATGADLPSRIWRSLGIQIRANVPRHGLADLDTTGDQDVVINCLDAGSVLTGMIPSAPRSGRAVEGQGTEPASASGARIEVVRRSRRSIRRWLCGRVSVERRAGFAPLQRAAPPTAWGVKVTWRTHAQCLAGCNRTTLTNSIKQAQHARSLPRNPSWPWFEDASAAAGAQHAEMDFDDFQRQPLAKKSARSAPALPGVIWMSVMTR